MLGDGFQRSVLLASWAPFRAGAEVAAERLAVGLQTAGHRVTVVIGTDGETLERLREAGIDVRFVPLAFTDKFRWLRYRAAQRAFRKVLLEVEPDLVHANDLPTSQMVGQATRRLGIPLVCHHRWIFEGAAIDWLNKFGADRHVFVSSWLRDALCERSPNLGASCCDVVHDGLPLPNVPTSNERIAARRELGLAADKSIVLYAGQLIERKGVADLLQAWSRLSPATRGGADLVVIGDDLENAGRYRSEMEQFAQQLSVDAQFFGHQRNVSQWITASDLCVVPSHEEPLGNATLEAMAHGRPIVATTVGGIPEMVVDGENGLLVPPRDSQGLSAAIDELLTNPLKASQMGLNGRARSEEQFSIDSHIAAMLHVYQAARSHSTSLSN